MVSPYLAPGQVSRAMSNTCLPTDPSAPSHQQSIWSPSTLITIISGPPEANWTRLPGHTFASIGGRGSFTRSLALNVPLFMVLGRSVARSAAYGDAVTLDARQSLA